MIKRLPTPYSRGFLAAPPTNFAMRPLTGPQTAQLFQKLVKHMGRPITNLLDHPKHPHVFRMHNARVYYLRESMANLPTPKTATGKNPAVGTCLGEFTYRQQKLRLHVAALNQLKNSVWGRDRAEDQGAAVQATKDMPLGVGASTGSKVKVGEDGPTDRKAFM